MLKRAADLAKVATFFFLLRREKRDVSPDAPASPCARPDQRGRRVFRTGRLFAWSTKLSSCACHRARARPALAGVIEFCACVSSCRRLWRSGFSWWALSGALWLPLWLSARVRIARLRQAPAALLHWFLLATVAALPRYRPTIGGHIAVVHL